jgi:hypothetical protein
MPLPQSSTGDQPDPHREPPEPHLRDAIKAVTSRPPAFLDGSCSSANLRTIPADMHALLSLGAPRLTRTERSVLQREYWAAKIAVL